MFINICISNVPKWSRLSIRCVYLCSFTNYFEMQIQTIKSAFSRTFIDLTNFLISLLQIQISVCIVAVSKCLVRGLLQSWYQGVCDMVDYQSRFNMAESITSEFIFRGFLSTRLRMRNWRIHYGGLNMCMERFQEQQITLLTYSLWRIQNGGVKCLLSDLVQNWYLEFFGLSRIQYGRSFDIKIRNIVYNSNWENICQGSMNMLRYQLSMLLMKQT